MRRVLLILVGLVGAAVVAFVVWALFIMPTPPPAAPPPAAERSTGPLQADAEGYYVPGYNFTVGAFRFSRITLRPETFVTFVRAGAGARREIGCAQAVIRPDGIQLQCDDEQVGNVTIDGSFLTRTATSRLDRPVLSAFVTIRSPRGEVRYRARDSFTWHPVD